MYDSGHGSKVEPKGRIGRAKTLASLDPGEIQQATDWVSTMAVLEGVAPG